jgi:hypothetical protein
VKTFVGMIALILSIALVAPQPASAAHVKDNVSQARMQHEYVKAAKPLNKPFNDFAELYQRQHSAAVWRRAAAKVVVGERKRINALRGDTWTPAAWKLIAKLADRSVTENLVWKQATRKATYRSNASFAAWDRHLTRVHNRTAAVAQKVRALIGLPPA